MPAGEGRLLHRLVENVRRNDKRRRLAKCVWLRICCEQGFNLAAERPVTVAKPIKQRAPLFSRKIYRGIE